MCHSAFHTCKEQHWHIQSQHEEKKEFLFTGPRTPDLLSFERCSCCGSKEEDLGTGKLLQGLHTDGFLFPKAEYFPLTTHHLIELRTWLSSPEATETLS